MSEHKYTDEEVIKALEYHSDPAKTCVSECAYGYQRYCGSKMAKDALDLINRQKAEISALTSAVDNSTQEFLKLHDKYQEQKAEVAFWMDAAANAKKEAVKEFAERLKKELTTGAAVMRISTLDIINDLVQELTEEKT